MPVKFLLYVAVSIIVIWSMESLNINKFFKKNSIQKATVFYILLGISMIYLVTNFFYDVFLSLNI